MDTSARPPLEWLNYHHLLYFWLVAREGGLKPAAAVLRVSHSTVSAQIHALERALGETLFVRQGRRLALTDMGQLVFRYAGEIFNLGQELLDATKDRPSGRPLRLEVGVADAVPKLVAHRLLRPPRARWPPPCTSSAARGGQDRLLADLAVHALDVVLAEAPVPPGSRVRAFSHPLGESGVTFLATAKLAARPRGPAARRARPAAPAAAHRQHQLAPGDRRVAAPPPGAPAAGGRVRGRRPAAGVRRRRHGRLPGAHRRGEGGAPPPPGPPGGPHHARSRSASSPSRSPAASSTRRWWPSPARPHRPVPMTALRIRARRASATGQAGGDIGLPPRDDGGGVTPGPPRARRQPRCRISRRARWLATC